MSRDAERDWLMLRHAQCGIVDRGQALSLGFTASRIGHRLRSGQWQRVYEGVYATFSGPLPREARLWAAVRRAGEGAMLSHETAAEVQGLADKPVGAEIHVTVARRRRPLQGKRPREIVIHRSDQSLPQFPDGRWTLPCTRLADTVLDIVAAQSTFGRAYAWIDRAVAKDLVTVAVLRATLDGRTRMPWRSWLIDALADAGDGVESPLERRYARDVERAHGLPRAQRQACRPPDARAHYNGNWYADYLVAVEVDGPARHSTANHGGDRGEADKRRGNVRPGVDAAQIFRCGPVSVTERACESAALVAAALRRNGWTGTPHPCHRLRCAVARAPRPVERGP